MDKEKRPYWLKRDHDIFEDFIEDFWSPQQYGHQFDIFSEFHIWKSNRNCLFTISTNDDVHWIRNYRNVSWNSNFKKPNSKNCR